MTNVASFPTAARHPRFLGESRIDFIDRPVPEPGPGELLIQPKANALCKSDYGAYHMGSDTTPGHEMAGVVVANGPGTSIAPGTVGAVFLMEYCGQCRSCRLGLTNQCLDKKADYGFTHDGGYGPYTVIQERTFFPIDPSLTPAEATLLLDIMGTDGHALKRAKLVHPDIQSVLVTGAGPIGLGVTAMVKLTFGFDTPVLITDLVDYRLKLAERLGAKPIHIGKETIAEGMARHGMQRVDLAVDGSGRTAAREEAFGQLDRRGLLVCVGHGQDLHLKVSPDLIGPERAVLGSEYFCFDEMEANHRLLLEHRDYVSQIITHHYPVEEISAAFEAFTGQQTGKVVVEQ